MNNCKKIGLWQRYALVLLVLLVGQFSVSGQDFSYFKQLSKENGLSQSSVFAISEDHNGFLWFGTRDGLNKYDGYSFSVYRKDESGNGPAGNDIRYLYSDEENSKLWIGTLEGLSCLNVENNKFTNYRHNPEDNSSIASDHISFIVNEEKGNMWIGTSNGLDLLNVEKSKFLHFTNPYSEAANIVNTIFKREGNKFWIGTRDGLFEFDRDAGKFTKLFLIESSDGLNVSSIMGANNGNYWIGTSGEGLLQIDENGQLVSQFLHQQDDPKSLSHNDIRSFCYDKLGRLWIGTFEGLNLLEVENEGFTTFLNSRGSVNSMSDNSIKTVYCDKKGSLWIGTYYGGVNLLDEGYNQFRNYSYSPYKDGLNAPVVSSFSEDELGNLWIGTEGGGLNYFDLKRNSYKAFQYEEGKNSLAGNNVKRLFLDGSQLWIGHFNKGLDRFDVSSGKFKNYNYEQGLSNPNVYDILKLNGYLWLGTYAGGLNILDLATDQIEIIQNNPSDSSSISSNFIRVISRTKNGDIWLGTSKGINKVVQMENGLPISFKSYLEKWKIYTIEEDSNGKLWVGTISNGLIIFDPKSGEHQQFTMEEGLAGNSVFGILEDEKGYRWLSTNNGLSRFDIDEELFVNFNNSNGLSSAEFNYNAYYKTKDNSMLFGGINGFTRFDPLEILINKFVPEVVFTGLKQNNVAIALEKDINEIKEVSFRYNEANFTIDFAALDYSNPNHNYYSYKLEGLDNNWNFAIGKPSATYTIQKHGNYKFLLKGGNSSGAWNENVRELDIVVLAPPWRTWWAYCLYFLLGSASIFALLRYIRLRDSYELEIKEKQQKEELHKLKLNFFTNVAHEFRTPLTLIIGPLEDLLSNLNSYSSDRLKSRLLKINDNSQRMLNLVNQLMTFRKMEAGYEALKVSSVDLSDFTTTIFGLFEDHARIASINYELVLPADSVSAWIDAEKIEKVLFNLLSNAFKFTPVKGTIRLTLESEKDEFIFTVLDSGSGIADHLQDQIFQRFYEKNPGESSNLIKGTGIGLSLSKELVELHKGRLEVKSSKGKGSEFVVILRKGKSHFDEQEIEKIQGDLELSMKPAISVSNETTRKRSLVSETNLRLLVVDDNKEIADYIASIFDGKHKVIVASNGLEGLIKSKEFQPDLIISDVMMPEMDGFEFCNAIRSDLETSHIPFILLTAKTLLDDKLEGLKQGANDFISKPFHPEELRFKVDNLMSQRALLRKTFTEKEFNPSQIEITSADDLFLKDLLALVEKNIDNPEFKIEQFAHELAVSRALLFTKIKAMTDLTPKNFLKSFRMKRSVQLLESGKLTIHEVSYMVGYKDPKYFSKVFHREFGKNPSEYTMPYKV